jgi:serine/threonine protein kinase/Tol biopolymer transport system component
MTAPPSDRERWNRIEEICDGAMKRPPAERSAYLADACRGDDALRREVEALLAHEATAERFLAAAPGAVAASVLSGTRASLVGTTLGEYEITARLGEGGMGVVYRARDTRLDRDVALKLVADRHVTADGGARRLRHEARAAARLNHPNICTVHEVATIDGATCIAMELIEGTSLRSALASGPLPPDRVMRIGQQVADALEHAHTHGVVHRDLKSANVMLRPDDRVKVIDFGIAERRVRPGDETETARSRTTDGFMGTLAYAAPELLQGSPPDAASDIWSLGVVLYEMAAGRLPFDGRTESDLAAAILRDPWRPLPAATPPALARIIERCLARLPHARQARAGEVASALEVASGAQPTRATVTRRRLAAVALTAAAVLAIAVPAIYLRSDDDRSTGEPVRFKNPIQVTNAVGVEESPAWSPDGRTLAYSGSATGGLNEDWDIWVAQPGGGGEPFNRTAGVGGRNLFPAWSPDGSSIAFWSSRDGGGCYVMPVLGGSPRLIVSTNNLHPGPPQWSADSSLLSCAAGTFERALRQTVSITTLEVRESTELPGYGQRLFVSQSPGATHISVVTGFGGLFTDASELWVVAGDASAPFRTDGRTKIWSPRWSADGRTLSYLEHAGSAMSLWARRFSAGAPDGEPRSLTKGINIRDFAWTTDERRLAYSQGRRIANVYRVPLTMSRVATWADVDQLTFHQADNQCIALDRSGTRLVVTSDRSGSFDLWTMSASGGPMARVTTDPSAEWCADWSPDGTTLVFYAARSGNRDIYTVPAAGGPWRQITTDPAQDVHPLWTFDGREILFRSRGPGRDGNWISPNIGGAARFVGGRGAGSVPAPADGRRLWVVNSEVFAEQPDDAGPRVRLGRSSGAPRWTPDGRYVLLRAAGDRIHIVAADGRSPEQPAVDLRGRRGSIGVYGTPTDGKYVYFVWTEDVGDIWVMDVEL